mmetsp:Transcript_3143/g.4936  ORF Transcript_3143/g.4936 Transcript_3143/m.4936 type:complete len:1566 (-) Transcript_3143:77-4774(-)|eukprot:CAMPEP_0196809442 /NCGR_PEP_ID=MMETSP1362-20130617/9380_1 /TAXON_ID=163516 /ORGANISM="Leptocylindrus danicus, Strain CCMP1856" /LENGTH=1565 /DNA_ID=CAMNT_0042184137 /DNA_START=202 /DNA_END=4899 /DNA_ORIENTATION=+
MQAVSNTSHYVDSNKNTSENIEEVPSLAILARHTLLHGLAAGHPVNFDEEVSNPVILDEQFWDELMLEASERRLLSDTFLSALCLSGMPPHKLILKGGRGDAAVSDRLLLTNPSSMICSNSSSDNAADGISSRQKQQQTFSSVSDMLLSSLLHLRFSDDRRRRSNRQPYSSRTAIEDAVFDRNKGYNTQSQSDYLDRLSGEDELATALHIVARSCSNLERLDIGPFRLSSTGRGSGLTGSLKAISASCRYLRSINLNGVTLRGDQTGSTGSLSFFESFSQNCAETLEHLSLANCAGVYDRHVQALLLHGFGCPMLASLDLSFTGINNLTFAALCQRSWGALRKLKLDGTAVNIPWLKKIIKSPIGESLESLSLLACPALEKGSEVWTVLTSPVGILPNLTDLAIELWFSSAQLMEEIMEEQEDSFEPETQHIELGNGEGWACCHCTLVNEDFLLRCAACNGRRYSSFDAEIEALSLSTEEDEICEMYNFLPLLSPLTSFSLVVHIDDESSRLSMFADLEGRMYGGSNNEQSMSEIRSREVGSCGLKTVEPATMITKAVFASLPSSVNNLKLIFPGGTMFDTEGAITLVENIGEKLQNFELGSVVIDSVEAIEELTVGSPELKVLKIGAEGEMGVNFADILYSISKSQHLEELQLSICNSDVTLKLGDVVDAYVNRDTSSGSNENDVNFVCNALKTLSLHGCLALQRLVLPSNLKNLHISHCPSLTNISFRDPPVGDCNKLERLRLCCNLSLEPHSIAMFRLPCLKALHLDGMIGLQDWQVGDLVNSTRCLTSLRFHQCRALGDYLEWKNDKTFCPLSVLHFFRPSPKFETSTFEALFPDNEEERQIGQKCSYLRDLRIESASGLRGVLCRTKSGQSTLSRSASRLGLGALDEESEHSALLGLQGIQRMLESFVNRSRPGDEFGFPPTLNSYQRRLVHETAEVMDLDHETVRLNSGIKFVKVRRKLMRNIFGEDEIPINIQHAADAGINLPEPAHVDIWARNNNEREYEVGFDLQNNEDSSDEGEEEKDDSYNMENVIQEMFQLNYDGHVDEQARPSQAQNLGSEGIERILREYVASRTDGDEGWYGFPPSLSSYQRKLVHECAEDLHLEHESVRSNNGVKIVRVRVKIRRRNEERLAAEGMFAFDAEGDIEEEAEAISTNRRYQRPKSRKAARKAAKMRKAGKKLPDESYDISEDEFSDDNGSGMAYDPLLQCEIHGRLDSKKRRQLASLAHQLPYDADSHKAVCIRYLRGICPFQQEARSCQWGHFSVKASQLKRFGPLFDAVCGIGGRSRKKSFDENVTNDEIYEGGRRRSGSFRKSKSRRNRRRGSIGSEHDDGSDEEDRLSLSMHSAGTSSPGTSPGTSPATKQSFEDMVSSSPHFMERFPERKGSVDIMPTPLKLHRLMNLDLLECDGLTGLSFDAPCLVRCCLRGCTEIAFLNLLNATALTTLDVTDCSSLCTIPLKGKSLQSIRVAIFTSCKNLDGSFMSYFVNHCRSLRLLHIFGSGAAEKASNAKTRSKVKTKAGLAKLNAGRPKLAVITTKKEWREMKAKQGSGGDDSLLPEHEL